MALNIGQNGIAQRHSDGSVTLLRPGRNGGPGTEIAVPEALADAFRLATGDVVAGETEPLAVEMPAFENSAETPELLPDWDAQFDEPAAHRAAPRFGVTSSLRFPTLRLTTITQVNGLEGEAAEERPSARTQRSRSERTPPDRLLSLAVGPHDFTGRMLDFAAPLGAGGFGMIYGPHGAGLTRTLQSVLNGLLLNSPDVVPLVLLLRPRVEEATEWRRRFPQADIVVGSSAFGEGTPQQTLQMCDLIWEAAQRQTEQGRDVVLLVDSLTALWGALLEAEEADAQQEADSAQARQRIREWVQKAGCFHGEAPLGGGLGGSLTLLGTVWHQETDTAAEEDRELHPHLRLLEHILPEAAWLVPLSDTLTRQRLYPAIDIRRCRSQHEESLLPAEFLEPLLKVRGSLPSRDPLTVHLRLIQALEASSDLPGLCLAL